MFSLRKAVVLLIALVMVTTFGLMGCGSDSDTRDSDKLKVGCLCGPCRGSWLELHP